MRLKKGRSSNLQEVAMQAANGSVRGQAGQKRTLSRRDNKELVEGTVTLTETKEEGYTSSESSSDSTSSSSSTTSSSSVSSTAEQGNLSARLGNLDNIFAEDDFGK